MLGGDLGDIMKQAQAMQEKMQGMQEEQLKQEVCGESGAGLVKVTMNGRRDVKSIDIDDSIFAEEKTLLEDLLAAAFNDANVKLEKQQQENMKNLTGGIPLPEGFKFPF